MGRRPQCGPIDREHCTGPLDVNPAGAGLIDDMTGDCSNGRDEDEGGSLCSADDACVSGEEMPNGLHLPWRPSTQVEREASLALWSMEATMNASPFSPRQFRRQRGRKPWPLAESRKEHVGACLARATTS
ncbi:hypothetical protein BHM03_00038091 [Ensete ventricosum]|nr:hypothetical protein BHM03_00038091 [Ensete ventricosum]